MFITKNRKNSLVDYFDWDNYFSQENSCPEIQGDEIKRIFLDIRKHLQENLLQFTVTFDQMVNRLLKGIDVKNSPRILELGAGTGFLTRWLITKYGGRGVLVDSSIKAFERYTLMRDAVKRYIEYNQVDIDDFCSPDRFDITCSFGLIEHFENKCNMMNAHKSFLEETGHTIIVVPLDTPLTRAFYEVFPELNKGYRELLTQQEFKEILEGAGLEILNMEKSNHYSYDFIAAVSRLK